MKHVLNRLAAAALVGMLLPAAGAPVSYHFSGFVDDDEAGRGYLVFNGSFSFDSAAADTIADPSTAAYAHAGAPWGLSIAFDGGAAFTVNASFNVLVSNDLAWGDQWGLLAQDALQSIGLNLFNLPGTLFGSDALPLPEGGLTLASFDYGTLRWESAEGALQGHLSALGCSSGCSAATLPLPEPGSLLLALAGLALLPAARGRFARGHAVNALQIALTPQQIALVRESLARVAPVATQAAAMFYDRLFERQPDVAPLFRGDMGRQGERLMEMIVAAVGLLDEPERLHRTLAELGRRHAGYGVRDAHYEAIGGALLDTIAAGLGETFTPAHRAAWAAMYAHVSRVMRDAAH